MTCISIKKAERPSALCLSMLRGLVAFDTTSHKSNLAFIDHVETVLKALGARCFRVVSSEGDKANLFATFGPEDNGGLVLSAHSDVVPALEPDWLTDPFELVEKDGRAFGRGTTDMKGYLACVLATLSGLDMARLTTPLHVAVSFDEEVGCKGIPYLMEELARRNIQPETCIVGEPTSMRVIGSHKGALAFKCSINGRSAHSSQAPRGVNAIEYAARLVEFIRQLGLEMALHEPRQVQFEIPHSTLQTGVIHGGTAGNIVAGACHFHFDLRYLPGTSTEALAARIRDFADTILLPEMRARAPEATIEIRPTVGVPDFEEPTTSALTRRVHAAVGGPLGDSVSYGTEAGFFQRAGVSVVVCGPGNMADAHRANESVEMPQLAACEAALAVLLTDMLREDVPRKDIA